MGICTGDGVLEWMLPRLGRASFTHNAVGFGLMDDGGLVAGVAFDLYRPASSSMEGSIVCEGEFTRRFIRECFFYAFVNVGCNRLQTAVNVSNQRAIDIDLRLGFVAEGLLREGGTDGGDAVLLAMLRKECKWLYGNYDKNLTGETHERRLTHTA